ncbi:DsbA family oxidoreductase [Dactylosporangium sp. CA-092794]|uniref:DsbA family oxidoreductase n=1 Tax=Dactylosporangium sp. CA-092794 TaxID=3239929 RepID=UPI003D930ADA
MTTRQAGPGAVASTGVDDVIDIDVWSDVQCSWCYIGKRRFESAVQRFDGEVRVHLHTFELAPDAPVDIDVDATTFLMRARGVGPEQAAGMHGAMVELAAAEGLEYRFDRLQPTNSALAHELLQLAGAHGVQQAMLERLFRAYFTEGRHIGHHDELADLAAEVGLDRAFVVTALREHRHLADVRRDAAQARALGVRSVPFFVLDGKYGVAGAQTSAAFVDILDQVRAGRNG